MTVAGESNGGVARSITDITYGGLSLISGSNASDTGSGQQNVGIWYRDDLTGATGNDIQVTWSGNVNGTGFVAYSLNGTNPGIGATGGGDGTTATITTTAADSLVIGAFVANANPAATAEAPQTQTFAAGIGSAEAATGHQFVSSIGPASATFAGGGSRPVVAIAEFTAAPVPEPSVAIFGLLGLASLARRRR